jgi:hypothetical protein
METAGKSEINSEKIMNAEFCEKHLSLQEQLGLSRRQYCKVNNINYTQFLYWVKKFSLGSISEADGSIPLVAVKLKTKSEELSAETLCTLELKKSGFLKIHTLEALSYILERLS